MSPHTTTANLDTNTTPRMRIAIDIDGTWATNPSMWHAIAQLMTQHGAAVWLVTGRRAWTDDLRRIVAPHGTQHFPIIYTRGLPKAAEFRRQTGHAISIWIDDEPGTIGPATTLDITTIEDRTL